MSEDDPGHSRVLPLPLLDAGGTGQQVRSQRGRRGLIQERARPRSRGHLLDCLEMPLICHSDPSCSSHTWMLPESPRGDLQVTVVSSLDHQ